MHIILKAMIGDDGADKQMLLMIREKPRLMRAFWLANSSCYFGRYTICVG
ncbi:MAG TPA: hypothetical protein VD794_12890 [Flavisolibacter sp.]|nr:hypothetical protein [Flavisolibacter sp.]